MAQPYAVVANELTYAQRVRINFRKHRFVYLVSFCLLAYYFIFHYLPMFGIIVAFEDYRPARGFLNSKWVGLKHFRSFFDSPYATRLIGNTLMINLYQLLFGFPAPILLALLINEVHCVPFKRSVQTFSYLPHFISLVVVCGMLKEFGATTGVLNDMIAALGGSRVNLLSDASLFRTVYVASGIWQGIGWGSILYLATLSQTDPNLYEAAVIDGANRFHQAIHITLPVLVPLVVMQLIMRIGSMMSVGHEKIILLYTPLTYETADVISSYVYRRGLLEAQFSFGAAVDLFNSLVNLCLLVFANWFSRRTLHESLW